MKVLLINPPFLEVYKGFKSAAKLGAFYPPTGLLYLASSAIQAGHEVELLDVDIEGLTIEETMARIKEFNPQVVGITSTTPTYVNAVALLKEIKKGLNVITVLGGFHITIMKEEVLKETLEIDYGVFGEGEITFNELLAVLGKGEFPNQVDGVIFRQNGQVITNPSRELIKDLDSLPFPARHLLKRGAYLWSVPRRGVQEITILFTKRGCPFTCRFCSAHSMFSHQVRYRSVKNVVDELEEVVKNQKITHILVLDDTLVLRRDRMVELCAEIKKRGLVFTWEGMARANIIDPEILRLMNEVGLVRLSFGIESGDQKILNSENKGITLQQLRDAYKWTKACGIETRGSAIIGHPGDTLASVWRTIKFLRSLKHLDQVYINVMVPYPGTEVYEIAKNNQEGMRLLCNDFKQFIRYDNSVIEVNDLTRKRLIFLQKFGLLYFYLTPRRIVYNIGRAGLKIGIKNVFAFIRGIFGKSS